MENATTNSNIDFSITRRKMLSEAIDKCIAEMYLKAQPSVDINDYIEKIKTGEMTDKTQPYVYQRHYLSDEEAKYIANKYIDAYRFNNEWYSNIDLLIKDLKEGCTVDKWIERKGNNPGYKGYEKRKPLKKRFKDILDECNVNDKKVLKKLVDEVFDYIENRKNFYRFDNEENKFNFNVFLGACPTSNKQMVIDYWKEQGKDITIVDRNPDTFWMIDEGYTEEEIKEELGE